VTFLLEKLDQIKDRYEEIGALMADPAIATDSSRVSILAKEYASIEPIVSVYSKYLNVLNAKKDASDIIRQGNDQELIELAQDELAALEDKGLQLESELKNALIPKDPQDERNTFIEIRAAAGGDEAALFAADLYRMYIRYAQGKGWDVDLVDASETGIRGYKEIVFEIKGKGAFSRMKHESGTHRVQRIPVTESSGRLHTSTVTVAVLPEAEDVDIGIVDDELRIDIFHSGGAGGQNVNKVATAVRITHVPTGIMAVCQDERSQLRNKQKAMAVLKARLLAIAVQQQQKEISQDRKSQVGSGERSEKARTYNFPQDRITDHRIGLTVHSLQIVLEGDLDQIINPLIEWEQQQKLAFVK
jgi:peptide chain release factor 1